MFSCSAIQLFSCSAVRFSALAFVWHPPPPFLMKEAPEPPSLGKERPFVVVAAATVRNRSLRK